MRENKKWKKDIGLCLCLTAMFFLLLYVVVPEGAVYGSETDWYSQHVNLAETLRNTMVEKGTLTPDFIWLGGGNNAYNFSYYGYLRTDILFGYAFPQVSMEKILTTVMIGSFLCTVLLCYIWLRKKQLNPGPAFLGAFFCMTAACFFQFHRQIMFIDYMPFLMLALIFADRVREKRRMLFYCLLLVTICFESYYYAIACFFVIGLYWLQMTKEWKDIWFLIKMMALSGGCACILFLPTLMALMENKRASAGTDLVTLITPKLELRGLLYHPYGVGFSMVIL